MSSPWKVRLPPTQPLVMSSPALAASAKSGSALATGVSAVAVGRSTFSWLPMTWRSCCSPMAKNEQEDLTKEQRKAALEIMKEFTDG